MPTKPWGGASYHMWLASPLAQDAVFIGYLYGLYDQSFPKRVWRRLDVPSSLLLTAAFFMAWHIPNLVSLPLGYVLLQPFYTFVGCLIMDLSRVWTGTILYATLTHSAINLAASLLSPTPDAG